MRRRKIGSQQQLIREMRRRVALRLTAKHSPSVDVREAELRGFRRDVVLATDAIAKKNG